MQDSLIAMQTAPKREIPYTHIIDARYEQRYETSCEVHNASCCVSASGHFRIRKGRIVLVLFVPNFCQNNKI